MNVSLSELITLAPVFGVVIVAVILAFVLARGDDAARARLKRR